MSTPKSINTQQPEQGPTFWDFLEALTDLDNYVGRYNPGKGELEISHRADIPSTDKIIERHGKAKEARP